jgi:poly-gamma-glutamate synthesis protein (capsule biosynthesis protein)
MKQATFPIAFIRMSSIITSDEESSLEFRKRGTVRIGLTGDVMIGRAIDAILPYHVDGRLYEGYAKHADSYVDLAEKQNGPLPKHEIQTQQHKYIWGDLLHELRDLPDCLIVNLETALTTSDTPAPHKGINYRAHPKNVRTLIEAGVTIATLANNHVLDWMEDGLLETLKTIENDGILCAGAGKNKNEATRSAQVTVNVMDDEGKGTKIPVTINVIAVGFPSAGVPMSWRATHTNCGVNVEQDLTIETAKRIVKEARENPLVPSDSQHGPQLVIASLHWGPNWNWGIPQEWRDFAHTLIDHGADMVIGHSSHHVKGVEVYKGKMIAYGTSCFETK